MLPRQHGSNRSGDSTRLGLESLEDRLIPSVTIVVPQATESALRSAITRAATESDTVILDMRNLHGAILIQNPLPPLKNVEEIRGPGHAGPENTWLALARSPAATKPFSLLDATAPLDEDGQADTLTITGVTFYKGQATADDWHVYHDYTPNPPGPPERPLRMSRTDNARGGGLDFVTGSLTLEDCWFDENRATFAGGGLFFFGDELIVRNTRFTENVVLPRPEAYPLGLDFEGVVGGGAAVMKASALQIENSDFWYNVAGGIAPYTQETLTPPFNETVQRGTGDGGGLFVYDYFSNPAVRSGFPKPPTPVKIVGTEFDRNTAGRFGGGVAFYSWYNNASVMSAEISRSVVRNNTATNGTGGGIWSNVGFAPSFWSDTTIDGNKSTYGGQGIDLANSTRTQLVLRNLTITSNRQGSRQATPRLMDLPNRTHLDPTTAEGGVSAGLVVSPMISMYNTVLWDNSGSSDIQSRESSSVLSRGGNFVSKGSSAFSDQAVFDRVGTVAQPANPLLGGMQVFKLADYTTVARVPQKNSPLIDMGVGPMGQITAPVPLSELDQRLKPRSAGPRVDIGAIEVQPPPPNEEEFSIRGVVWEDIDGYGLRDFSEPGFEDVPVSLVAADGSVIQRTLTWDDGSYAFDGVAPGDYRVRFEAPHAYGFTTANAWGDDFDSDADPATGLTDLVTVSGVDVDHVDAGLVHLPYPTVEGTVWRDDFANNARDMYEMGMKDIGVELYTAAGDFVASTATDLGGHYRFADLDPGSYFVHFDRPVNHTFAVPDAAPEGVDSDADPATGSTAAVAVGLNGHAFLDAGFAHTLAQIGDTVWYDADGDGSREDYEGGLPGLPVVLRDIGLQVVGSTTTDEDGAYSFTDVAPGSYTVEFTGPAGWVSTTGGTSRMVVVGAGDDFRWADAGFRPDGPPSPPPPPPMSGTGTVTGRLWWDDNGNGIQDGAERGEPSVFMQLWDADTNMPVASGWTAGGGQYVFTNVPAGRYAVVASPSAMFTLADQGTDDTIDSDFNRVGFSPVFTLADGDTVSHLDGGLVYLSPSGGIDPGPGPTPTPLDPNQLP